MATNTYFVQNLSLITSQFSFPLLQFRISCSSRFNSAQFNAYPHQLQPAPEGERPEVQPCPGDNETKKKTKKKELRPNFYHQTLRKWSVKISSQRTKFPWQDNEVVESERARHCSPAIGMPVEPSTNRPNLGFLDSRAQVIDSSEPTEKLPSSSNRAKPRNSQRAVVERTSETEAYCIKVGIPLPSSLIDNTGEKELYHNRSTVSSTKLRLQEVSTISSRDIDSRRAKSHESDAIVEAASSIPLQTLKSDADYPKSSVSARIEKVEEYMDQCNQNDASSPYGGSYHVDTDNSRDSIPFPWEKWKGVSSISPVKKRSNTEMAERTIPELDLRRLRNEALRLKERMRVGPGGVTEAIVESIHQKWKETEVVKLHIEGPPALNMKRTHEILEEKTSGIVIWRSGSSIVLYRGLTYKLHCARSVSQNTDIAYGSANLSITAEDLQQPDACIDLPSTTFESSSYASDVDSILNELGPRYKDWSGHDPLPVDADLLPGIIPDYKPPFRYLPHKTKRTLTNRQMTFLRRIARSMVPHFALGRNKQHQGLASGMVKLWEKSAIAKIAIKRGVQNTSNERMAEEIKELTGGTLLSRNKEYIVFYRGNDFLTPSIRQTFVEREKLAAVQQDAEEDARSRASPLLNSSSKPMRGPFVAGTLAETLEAYNQWGNRPSNGDRDKMRTALALSQHASLVRYLERKLYFAIKKVRDAEKALAKLQESLQPSDLPTDLETVTNEERILFRNIGLKMGAYLPLGRRGVFDGTIQNIHLNWKHMELAKIIVKAKNLAQVKHIAISLEAESGGVLISVDKTTKGYVIILYRGKNYLRPHALRPKNLLSKREALARSIELQRREALSHHIANLREEIQTQRSRLAQMKHDIETSSEERHLEVVDSFSDYDVEEGKIPSLNIQHC
ncbi:hypothetical protein KSP39_PZI011364 [Platanthera zijinensis]|uniref:CRM domain-containing protein n=1 Tax=Platanthera zijinensis TaxID=2320716 RepID=A0AAP0BJ14_9ASPA